MRLPPFQQGGLDSVCGLYSIVNADRIVNGSTAAQSQQLYDDLIRWLSRRGMLKRALIGGISNDRMQLILHKGAAGRFGEITVPWRGVTTPGLDEFWRSMQDFMGTAPLKKAVPGRAIILGLNGFHDHWTVVRDITARSIWLYDSDGIQRLPRHDCSTTKDHRTHTLRPAQSYFVRAA